MTVRWSEESVRDWREGRASDRTVRIAQRWRFRVASDRLAARGEAQVGSRGEDFYAALDGDLELWVRTFTGASSFSRSAHGGGVSVDLGADITLGLRHEVGVRLKPSDESRARWSCSCGVASRGESSPEQAHEAARAHEAEARGRGASGRMALEDSAVVQETDGSWSRRGISIIRRVRTCVRSDLSAVRAHKTGHGEEFELAVDGNLRLWTRVLGSEAALRRDDDARGVSLMIFDVA